MDEVLPEFKKNPPPKKKPTTKETIQFNLLSFLSDEICEHFSILTDEILTSNNGISTKKCPLALAQTLGE